MQDSAYIRQKQSDYTRAKRNTLHNKTPPLHFREPGATTNLFSNPLETLVIFFRAPYAYNFEGIAPQSESHGKLLLASRAAPCSVT